MRDKRPVAPEGFSPESAQLAVRDEQPSLEGMSKVRLITGILWCLIGSISIPIAPFVSNELITFGMTTAMANRGRRERLIVLLCSLVAAVASSLALSAVYDLPITILMVLASFGLAREMVKGTLRTGWVVATATLIGCVMIASSVWLAQSQGMTVSQLVTNVVDEVIEPNVSSLDLTDTQILLETRDSMVSYWPSIYFSVGVFATVCSLLGAWLGARAGGQRVEPGMISRYDVPLWVAVAFALGVAVELLGPYAPAWRDQLVQIGANVVMCSRILLAQQGISVLLWLTRSRGVSMPARMLVVMLALWLEMSFALTSVLGLVDVACNFRHMERTRADLLPRPESER